MIRTANKDAGGFFLRSIAVSAITAATRERFAVPRDQEDMTFQALLKSSATMTADYLERRFHDHSDAPVRLNEAMRYALLNGGKRFRPFLVMESAKLFGVSYEASLPTAAALECIHCYSLVHDDLPAMDDDDLRRGRPTVHIAFDEATAILAGDGLLTYAFEILGEPATHNHADVRCSLILSLAKAAGLQGMAGGQALDLQAEQGGEQTLEDVARIQSLKTGALITFACEAGALIGMAGSEEKRALEFYGDKIGQAFQVADDLLDVEGDPNTVGKATDKDQEAGKATYVSLLGVDGAKTLLKRLEQEAIESLSLFGEQASGLVEAAHFAVQRNH